MVINFGDSCGNAYSYIKEDIEDLGLNFMGLYGVKMPENYVMLFDIDSTLLDTYGHQEGEGFNFHYQAHGYHPLLCYDGLTGDLLKAELRDGTMYCSKEADDFMRSLLDEFIT